MGRNPRPRNPLDRWSIAIGTFSLLIALLVALYGDNLLGRGERTPPGTEPPGAQAARRPAGDPPAASPPLRPAQLGVDQFVAKLGGRWRRSLAGAAAGGPISDCSSPYTFAFADGVVSLEGPEPSQLKILDYRNGVMRAHEVDEFWAEREAAMSWDGANPDRLIVNYGPSPYYPKRGDAIAIFDKCS